MESLDLCKSFIKYDKKRNKLKNKYKKEYNIKSNKSIIVALFLDNIDIVYQKYCENYFLKDTNHKFINTYSLLIEEIKKSSFHDNQILLFTALRPESMMVLKKRIIGKKSNING